MKVLLSILVIAAAISLESINQTNGSPTIASPLVPLPALLPVAVLSPPPLVTTSTTTYTYLIDTHVFPEEAIIRSGDVISIGIIQDTILGTPIETLPSDTVLSEPTTTSPPLYPLQEADSVLAVSSDPIIKTNVRGETIFETVVLIQTNIAGLPCTITSTIIIEPTIDNQPQLFKTTLVTRNNENSLITQTGVIHKTTDYLGAVVTIFVCDDDISTPIDYTKTVTLIEPTITATIDGPDIEEVTCQTLVEATITTTILESTTVCPEVEEPVYPTSFVTTPHLPHETTPNAPGTSETTSLSLPDMPDTAIPDVPDIPNLTTPVIPDTINTHDTPNTPDTTSTLNIPNTPTVTIPNTPGGTDNIQFQDEFTTITYDDFVARPTLQTNTDATTIDDVFGAFTISSQNTDIPEIFLLSENNANYRSINIILVIASLVIYYFLF